MDSYFLKSSSFGFYGWLSPLSKYRYHSASCKKWKEEARKDFVPHFSVVNTDGFFNPPFGRLLFLFLRSTFLSLAICLPPLLPSLLSVTPFSKRWLWFHPFRQTSSLLPLTIGPVSNHFHSHASSLILRIKSIFFGFLNPVSLDSGAWGSRFLNQIFFQLHLPSL